MTQPPEALHEQYFGHTHVTVIEPQRGWRTLDLKELWAYRELLWVLTLRDVKVRYKQTVLGVAWAVIQPVMTMVVFTIFFGRLANEKPENGTDGETAKVETDGADPAGPGASSKGDARGSAGRKPRRKPEDPR